MSAALAPISPPIHPKNRVTHTLHLSFRAAQASIRSGRSNCGCHHLKSRADAARESRARARFFPAKVVYYVRFLQTKQRAACKRNSGQSLKGGAKHSEKRRSFRRFRATQERHPMVKISNNWHRALPKMECSSPLPSDKCANSFFW